MEPFIVSLAQSIATKAVTTALQPLINQLLRVQSNQEEQLRQIAQDVQRLIDAPWYRARLHLEVAAHSPRNLEFQLSSLEKARDALIEACSLQPDGSMAAALISADLSLIEGVLGRVDERLRWILRAHGSAVLILSNEANRLQTMLNQKRRVGGLLYRDDLDRFWADLEAYNGKMLEASRTPSGTLGCDDGTDAELLTIMHDSRPSGQQGGPFYLRARNKSGFYNTESFAFNPSAMPYIEAFADLQTALLNVKDFAKMCEIFGSKRSECQLTLTLRRRGQAVVKYGLAGDARIPLGDPHPGLI